MSFVINDNNCNHLVCNSTKRRLSLVRSHGFGKCVGICVNIGENKTHIELFIIHYTHFVYNAKHL